MKQDASTRSRLLITIVLAATLGGCESYALRGRIVEGPVSAVTTTGANDQRLTESHGISNAVVEVILDPDRLSAKSLGLCVSETDGSFSLPVDEMGAGFLEYDIRIIARHAGYQQAIHDMMLPGEHKRLLIILTPGRDTYKPGKGNIIDETLDLAEPYLRNQ